MDQEAQDIRLSLAEVALSPVNYFALEVDCFYLPSTHAGDLGAKYRLPSTGSLCDEETFADLYMGWSQEGLFFKAHVHKKVESTFYPSPEQGDSVELFIDTRDRKLAGFNNRFCHHFCFLPEAVEGVMGHEMTRFRTEDAHELCAPLDLKVSSDNKKTSYTMNIFIPSHCLHGYDPEQLDRLGFTYRVNRPDEAAQHFCLLSSEYQIDQQPALWSSLKLVNS